MNQEIKDATPEEKRRIANTVTYLQNTGRENWIGIERANQILKECFNKEGD